MTRRAYHACRECWDPVEQEKSELCDYCLLTPEQRRRIVRRNFVIIAVALLGYVAMLFWPTGR